MKDNNREDQIEYLENYKNFRKSVLLYQRYAREIETRKPPKHIQDNTQAIFRYIESLRLKMLQYEKKNPKKLIVKMVKLDRLIPGIVDGLMGATIGLAFIIPIWLYWAT